MGRPQQSYYDHLLLGKTKSVVMDVLSRLNSRGAVPFSEELAALAPYSNPRASGSSNRRKAEYSYEQFTQDLDGSNSLVGRIVETLIKETALQAHITQATAASRTAAAASSRSSNNNQRSVRSPSPNSARRFSVYNPTSTLRSSRRGRRAPHSMFAPAAGAPEVGLEGSGSENDDYISATTSSSATPEPTPGSLARALELEHLQNQTSTARQLAATAQANASAALRAASNAMARRPLIRSDVTSLQRAQRRAEDEEAQANADMDLAFGLSPFSAPDSAARSVRTAMFENNNNNDDVDAPASSSLSEAMQNMDRGLMARLDAMRASHSRLSYLQSSTDARSFARRESNAMRGTTVDASTNTTNAAASGAGGSGGSGAATYLGRGRSTFLPQGAARAARLAIPMPPPAALESSAVSLTDAVRSLSERAEQFRVMSSQARAASRQVDDARQPFSSSSSSAPTATAAAASASVDDANPIRTRGGEAYTPSVHDARARRGAALPEAADWQRLQARLTEAMCDAFSMLRQDLNVGSDEARRLLNEANALRAAEGAQGASYVGELSCLVEMEAARELDVALERIPRFSSVMQSNARRWMTQASWAWSHALRIVEALPTRPFRLTEVALAPLTVAQQQREAAALSRTTWLALQDYYDWAVAQETRTMEPEVGMERVIAAQAYLCDRFGYDPDIEELNEQAIAAAAAVPSMREVEIVHGLDPFRLAPLQIAHTSAGEASVASPAQAQAQVQAEPPRRVLPLPPRARTASSASLASTNAASSSGSASARRPAALTPWTNTSSSGSSSTAAQAPVAAERRLDERLASSAASAVEEADRALRE